MELLKEVEKRAKALNKKYKIKIAFPEAEDDRVRKAVDILVRKKICEPFLIFGGFLQGGISKAQQMLMDNEVDAIIAGSHCSSTDTLLLAFKFKDPDIDRISGAMLMVPKDKNGRIMLFADVVAQPKPTPERLAEIAVLSAKTFKLITKKKPIVALLSYSTHGSGKGERPLEIKEATGIAKKKLKDIKVDGEIQVDSALIPWVAKYKGAKIEGKANVLIFPCLNAGNISYKLIERLANYTAVGGIFQGMDKQVNDLSRGCSVEDIVNLAMMTVLQVAEKKN